MPFAAFGSNWRQDRLCSAGTRFDQLKYELAGQKLHDAPLPRHEYRNSNNPAPLKWRPTMKKWATFAVYAGILNFALFAIGTFVVGGDAVNARQLCPAGNYLWDKSFPSPCHEISRAVYLNGKGHVYSLLLSWPFVIGSALYLSYLKAAEKADRSGPQV